MKQIVRAPPRTSAASSSAASRQRASARVASASSSSGGFHIAIWRARAGRAVAVDEREVVEARQALGELHRVGDRRGGEQEARLGAVGGGEAAQAPQHVGDVRAEHAAVDVRLVDDDDGEVREQVAPGGVVGQDPDVEHVGVGEDEVRAPADRRALLARRVAVVDRRAHALASPSACERPRLVLGQRLGRVQVQRPRAGGRGSSTSSVGQVEAQRLARGGAGGDDRSGRPQALCQRLGLVRVQLRRCRRRAARRAARGAGRREAARAPARARPRTPRARAARRRGRPRAARPGLGAAGARQEARLGAGGQHGDPQPELAERAHGVEVVGRTPSAWSRSSTRASHRRSRRRRRARGREDDDGQAAQPRVDVLRSARSTSKPPMRGRLRSRTTRSGVRRPETAFATQERERILAVAHDVHRDRGSLSASASRSSSTSDSLSSTTSSRWGWSGRIRVCLPYAARR